MKLDVLGSVLELDRGTWVTSATSHGAALNSRRKSGCAYTMSERAKEAGWKLQTDLRGLTATIKACFGNFSLLARKTVARERALNRTRRTGLGK